MLRKYLEGKSSRLFNAGRSFHSLTLLLIVVAVVETYFQMLYIVIYRITVPLSIARYTTRPVLVAIF